jgi:hypothetical protein
VFSGCFARAEAARAEDEAHLAAFCRGALGSWRAHARDTRAPRRARLALRRADAFARAAGSARAWRRWRAVVLAARAAKAEEARRAAAFAAWLALVRHRREVRRRVSAYAARRYVPANTRPADAGPETAFGDETSEASIPPRLVRAWRAWRGRAATGRAATRLRRKALARFLWPALSAWRAVALAALRDEVLAGLRVDAHSRNAMWRAWRAWALGPASAALARGAPTPHVPGRRDPFPSRSAPRGNVPAGDSLETSLGRGRGGRGLSGARGGDPAAAGGGAARAAGTVARRRVLGRVALAGWQTVSARRGSAAASEADPNAGREPGGASGRAAAGPPTSFTPPTLADAEAVLARAERRAPPNARARIPLARRLRGTVAAAVAAAETATDDADDASEVSDVPPIAAVDPEVYAAARRAWRFTRGRR